jgi:hypothetical protein
MGLKSAKNNRWRVAVLWLFVQALPLLAAAHEIPADVRAVVFVKPVEQRLEVLIRAPLAVARDEVYPEIDGGFLDVDRLRPRLPELAQRWLVDSLRLTQNGQPLTSGRIAATQLSFAGDTSFQNYDSAMARLRAAGFGNEARVAWNQLWFDVLLVYPIQAEDASFGIQTGFERLGMTVSCMLRFLPSAKVAPPGTERIYSLHMEGGSGDTGLLELDPRWHQAAMRFASMGVEHILGGIDHILFLVCLVIPVRRFRPLLVVVTAFTVAHSLTMICAALGFVPRAPWFPPLVESLIALSIVWMALTNIVRAAAGTAWNPVSGAAASGESPSVGTDRWILAFVFGLVHGFGFSFALTEQLQFAGSQVAVSLGAFNVGVEIGQLAVLLLLLPLIHVLFRYVVSERLGAVMLSALIAHTGWHWMLERGELLAMFWGK